jgi:hypothetical protein
LELRPTARCFPLLKCRSAASSRKAPDDSGVSIIACPIDYAENMNLPDKLAALTDLL